MVLKRTYRKKVSTQHITWYGSFVWLIYLFLVIITIPDSLIKPTVVFMWSEVMTNNFYVEETGQHRNEILSRNKRATLLL